MQVSFSSIELQLSGEGYAKDTYDLCIIVNDIEFRSMYPMTIEDMKKSFNLTDEVIIELLNGW